MKSLWLSGTAPAVEPSWHAAQRSPEVYEAWLGVGSGSVVVGGGGVVVVGSCDVGGLVVEVVEVVVVVVVVEVGVVVFLPLHATENSERTNTVTAMTVKSFFIMSAYPSFL